MKIVFYGMEVLQQFEDGEVITIGRWYKIYQIRFDSDNQQFRFTDDDGEVAIFMPCGSDDWRIEL